jgi:hypothetical protein
MAALDLLRDARRLLAHEAEWCQLYTVHPNGRGRSALGAVGYRFYRVEHPDSQAAVFFLARAIGRGQGPHDAVFVQGFNDEHSHREVLDLLDKAIALAEADAERAMREVESVSIAVEIEQTDVVYRIEEGRS